ncbi:hypothetical protein [Larsenimonas rhizosphaerae]|uniref:Uncharacterized protein n=1 Tax=Larsenimonas rhizosphaerae TaxID=2944682 RepID=A0AA41ZLA2_9GAMM|nr:hypothetical protein [Larsenimonas rhizosphaerae]MCM2130168.1 hypothetical protein [Larsenimonas rhizosphaerae]MCX2522855.1 hypothetical protein [Larsenimonas rhizosphaerae]
MTAQGHPKPSRPDRNASGCTSRQMTTIMRAGKAPRWMFSPRAVRRPFLTDPPV